VFYELHNKQQHPLRNRCTRTLGSLLEISRNIVATATAAAVVACRAVPILCPQIFP